MCGESSHIVGLETGKETGGRAEGRWMRNNEDVGERMRKFDQERGRKMQGEIYEFIEGGDEDGWCE